MRREPTFLGELGVADHRSLEGLEGSRVAGGRTGVVTVETCYLNVGSGEGRPGLLDVLGSGCEAEIVAEKRFRRLGAWTPGRSTPSYPSAAAFSASCSFVQTRSYGDQNPISRGFVPLRSAPLTGPAP